MHRKTLVPASVIALLAIGPTQGLAIYADGQPQPQARHLNDATISAHRDRQAQLVEANVTIMNSCDGANNGVGRDMTEAEAREVADNTAEINRLEAEIDRRVTILDQQARFQQPAGRRSAPMPVDSLDTDDDPPVPNHQARGVTAGLAAANPAPAGRRLGTAGGLQAPLLNRRATVGGDFGFRAGLGEQAQAIYRGSIRGGEVDPRLMHRPMRNAPATTYQQEGVGADGGFLVAPDFRTQILEYPFRVESFVGRTDQWTTGSNAIVVPLDTDTPWSQGGIQAYWEGEATTLTQSKFKLEQQSFRLHKLGALVPVTDEILEDAASLEALLVRKARARFDWKLSWALFYGTGVGMPLGILNSPALVTVPAEGGQAADTLVPQNVANMWARMPVDFRNTAVWVINPDLEPTLMNMQINGQNVYMPAGGLAGSPYGTLMGRPVIPHQVARTKGELGDIVLVDFAQYLTAIKGGLRQDVSMHLWFDQDLTAFRFIMRVAGHPWWPEAVSPREGNLTQSPYITLAAR